jgi:hypothetical protein
MNYSSDNLSHPPAEHPKDHKDFGDGANPLWSLFSKQAKTQDEARIQSLVGDMDGVLRIRASIAAHTDYIEFMNVCISTGWFVFCGSYFFPCPKYSGIAAEPCTAISVLPATVVGEARPNFASNGIHRPAGFHPIYSPTSLPSTQPIVF